MSIHAISWTRVSITSFMGFVVVMSLIEKLYF